MTVLLLEIGVVSAVILGAELPVFVAAMRAWPASRAQEHDALRFPHAVRTELQQRLVDLPASQNVDTGLFAPRLETVKKADLADVLAVDPKKMTITVKSPKGNIVDLKVKNPDHFKVVKKGDQIEMVYVEALAMSVEPAPKKAAAK